MEIKLFLALLAIIPYSTFLRFFIYTKPWRRESEKGFQPHGVCGLSAKKGGGHFAYAKPHKHPLIKTDEYSVIKLYILYLRGKTGSTPCAVR